MRDSETRPILAYSFAGSRGQVLARPCGAATNVKGLDGPVLLFLS